ncbi:MAG: AAA family ATPase [Sphaerochaetaceae bacterium]|jgi:hypothetical protein|nr:AAA family ATPase [Sphaerochaetaceae bacterium]
MLIEYRVSNFKAIRQETGFSFLASAERREDDDLIDFEGRRYLRSSVIIGANASGKSSFLGSILLLRSLVLESAMKMPGDELEACPHWDCADSPTAMMAHFTRLGQRYLYSLSLYNGRVLNESLHHYPRMRKEKVFVRALQRISFAPCYRAQAALIEPMIKPNRLALSIAAGYSSIEPAIQAYLFFRDQVMDGNAERGFQDHGDLMSFLAGCGYRPRQFSRGLDKLADLYTSLQWARVHNGLMILDDAQSCIHTLAFESLVHQFNCPPRPTEAQVLFATSIADVLEMKMRHDQIWFSSMSPQSSSVSLFCLLEAAEGKPGNLRKSYLEGCYGAIPLISGK